MTLTNQSAPVVIESVGLDPAGRAATVTTLTDGRFVVVWQEDLSQPVDDVQDTDGAIFARIYAADGTADSDLIRVNGWMPGLQDSPTVAATSDGGFSVVFQSTAVWGETGVDVDSVMTRFDANGNRQPFLVPDPADETATIAVNFLDLATDNPTDLSEDGTKLIELGHGLVGVITNYGTVMVFDPTAVIDEPPTASPGIGWITDLARQENGNILMVGETGDGAIVLRLSDAALDGEPADTVGLAEPVEFFTRAGKYGTEVRVIALHPGTFAPNGNAAAGGFVVSSLEPSQGLFTTLCLQTFTAWGAILSTATVTIEGISLYDQTPAYDILALQDGTFVVSWVMKGANGLDIMVGHYDADGAALGDPMLVQPDAASGTQTDPSLTQLEDGRMLLVFTDLGGHAIDGMTEPLHAITLTFASGSGGFLATSGDDTLRGTGAGDAIDGLAGNDSINGNAGDDALYGAAGLDTLRGDAGDDAVQGGADRDRLFGGDGNDGLAGGAGADRLSGDAGRDGLLGGSGNDSLFGGTEDDRLSGASGDDRLTGGSGADVFLFRAGAGRDVITDFTAEDVLRLDRALWAADGSLTRAEVIADFGSVVGGNFVLTFDDGSRITLQGVTSLGAEDLQLI